MGKIRVTTIGDTLEEEDKKKKDIKKAEKKARQQAEAKAKSADEVATDMQNNGSAKSADEASASSADDTNKTIAPEKKKVKIKKEKDKESSRSKVYTENAMQVDKNKIYSVDEGIKLLKGMKNAKFDETVELHINTTESGISGQMKLPHGNGKEIRVAIADDKILSEVEKGKINFDVLVAAPTQMPSLAKVAKVLGPRGLMPNPKNGTISEKPEEAAKKFKGGQMNYKTESKLPLIHLVVGKVSFEDKKLSENINTALTTVGKDKIKNVTLKSTMSPGIRIQA